ncbi:hypothetical protein [Streptomyces harbinensis]|uniref:hypothetical protein n=1 Tax=Streptomyces harbinensis TaxID=1176198 RepID=UPI0034DE7C1E
MSTRIAAIDRDKSPLLDADHDLVRIADALLGSPHIRSVTAVAPGDETIWFTDASGTRYALSLTTVEPIPDGPQDEAFAWDAVAAAIGNHPDFVSADLPQKSLGRNLDTFTVCTRTGNEYTLEMTVALPPEDRQELASPAADVAYAADRLLTADASDQDRAVAGLLNYVAATWDRQDAPLRGHAQALARSLNR